MSMLMNQPNVDLRYWVVCLIGFIILSSSHTVLADNSVVPWKITIQKNESSTNGTNFLPTELQAREGDVVTWINNDTVTHTITSGTPGHLNYSGKIFDSGPLHPGEQFSFKIPSGIWSAYYYFCKIHPWMTGKIDVGLAYLEKSPTFTITTDKKAYLSNETISISGIVNDTSQIMPLSIQIFDSHRSLVFIGETNLLPNHSFSYKLIASDSIFKESGSYKIKAFYGFPATVTDSNFFFNSKNENVTDADNNSVKIQHWVKDDAKWWSQNQISDKEFVKGIQFLIKSGMLKVHNMNPEVQKTGVIPYWIRSDAGWWASGGISDKEFISDIQFLLDHGIINI